MNHRDEDDPFEEDIVFDQAGLLSSSHKSGKSAIRRISSGKCATFSKTLALCGAFLGLGLTCAIPGPLSPIPPTELSDDVSLMSPEIMFRCFGFMIGAMFGAKLLDRFNRLFLVFLALLVTAILVIIIPWCRMAWLLRTDMFLVGGTIGFLSTGGNVLCLDLWGRNSGPFMQALQFSFSLGVFLAPLLSQPLMSASNATTPSVFPHNRLPRSAFESSPHVDARIIHIPGLSNLSDSTMKPSSSSFINISTASSLSTGNSPQPTTPKSSSAGLQTSVTPMFLISSTTTKPISSSSPKIALPASFAHSPPTNVSHIDVENSSTTHRVPKPKPELTNSDKLKDKNWENNKFRKPPPEDLVPVSSTMKTTTHSSPASLSSNGSTTLNSSFSTISSQSEAPTSKSTFSSVNVSSSAAPSLQTNVTIPLKGSVVRNTSLSTTPTPALSTSVAHEKNKQFSVSWSSPPSLPPTQDPSHMRTVLSRSGSVRSTTGVSHLTTEGPGLKSLSLLDKSQGTYKLPTLHNITESRVTNDHQTHPLPLLEKPNAKGNPAEESNVHNTKYTTPHQGSKPTPSRMGQFETALSDSKPKAVKETTVLYRNNSSAVLSSINSSEVSLKNGASQDVANVSTSTVASTRRTHHSKPASTVVNDTEVTHTVIGAFANRLEKYGLSKMELIYLVVGMVLLATSLLFLGFLCFNPRDPKSKTDEEEMNGHHSRGRNASTSSSRQTSVPPPLPRWLRNTLMALMLVILLITSGIQAMYGQLLEVFASQSPLQLSESTGTALTATFWGALTSSRFACILLASALSPTAMLVLSVALCSCATWLLSALASSSEVALWIGSVMVGVGTASIFPSGLLWMQRHVVVTHRVAAMLVMGPAMGEMLLPMLVYKMMVAVGPGSLLHLPALLSLCVIALWATAWRLARHPRWQADGASGYQLANQNDEDDLLDLTMSPVINGGGVVSRSTGRPHANGHSFHRLSS